MKTLSEIQAYNLLKQEFIDHYNIYDESTYKLEDKRKDISYYEGQIELARYLARRCSDNPDDFIIDMDNSIYENVFFDKLYIKYNDKGICTYINDSDNYNIKNKKLDKFIFLINQRHRYNYNVLSMSIMHGLMHAYRDYNSYINGSDYLFNICNNDIINNKIYDSFNSEIRKENYIFKLCEFIISIIPDTEIKVYTSEFRTICINNISKIQDYSKMIDIFLDSEAYTNYQEALNSIYFIKDNKQYHDEFLITYNKLSNSNYKFNELIKYLIQKFESILNKMEINFPDVYIKVLEKYNKKVNPELYEYCENLIYKNPFIKAIKKITEQILSLDEQ